MPAGPGRPKKISSPKKMADAWEEFKQRCDSKTVVRTEFSQRESRFVTETIPAPVSYTLLGFCNYLGLSTQAFSEYYESDERFVGVVNRVKQECEEDVREKFENKTIPQQLSGLWMSKFGYSTKTEQDIHGSVPVVIGGSDGLSD